MITNGMICLLDMNYWHVYSNVNNYFIYHHLFFHKPRETEYIPEGSSKIPLYRCIDNITHKMFLTSLPDDVKFEVMTHLDSFETLGLFLDATPSTTPLFTAHFYTITKQTLKSTWKHPTTQVFIRHRGSPYLRDPITTTHNSHAFSLPSTFPNTREALDYMCTVQQAAEYFKKDSPYPDKSIRRNEWVDWEILRVQLYTELFHISSFLHDSWEKAYPRFRAFWDRFTKDEEMESKCFVGRLCSWLVDRYGGP